MVAWVVIPLLGLWERSSGSNERPSAASEQADPWSTRSQVVLRTHHPSSAPLFTVDGGTQSVSVAGPETLSRTLTERGPELPASSVFSCRRAHRPLRWTSRRHQQKLGGSGQKQEEHYPRSRGTSSQTSHPRARPAHGRRDTEPEPEPRLRAGGPVVTALSGRGPGGHRDILEHQPRPLVCVLWAPATGGRMLIEGSGLFLQKRRGSCVSPESALELSGLKPEHLRGPDVRPSECRQVPEEFGLGGVA